MVVGPRPNRRLRTLWNRSCTAASRRMKTRPPSWSGVTPLLRCYFLRQAAHRRFADDLLQETWRRITKGLPHVPARGTGAAVDPGSLPAHRPRHV